MLTFLEAEGIKMNCTNADVVDFGLSVASDDMNYDEILEWINKFKNNFSPDLTRTTTKNDLHLNLMCRNIKNVENLQKNYIDNILRFVYNINCRIYLLYK